MKALISLHTLRSPGLEAFRWLSQNGIPLKSVPKGGSMFAMTGRRAPDGHFEEDAKAGEEWWMFPQPGDFVFWHPRSGEYARWYGRAFALNQLLIHSATTFAFDGMLDIYADPIEWLRHERCGIVIIDWRRVYEMLRDCPRIRVSEAMADRLVEALKPTGPEIFVRPSIPGDIQ